jgi:hypothetical protein
MAYLYLSLPIAVIRVIFRVYCTDSPPASHGKRAVGSVSFYLACYFTCSTLSLCCVSSPFLNL